MNQLIYHLPAAPEGESPFDREIAMLATGCDIKIVSPYIGLSYLTRLVGMASSWRLISDLQEWLTSQSAGERQKILRFLQGQSKDRRGLSTGPGAVQPDQEQSKMRTRAESWWFCGNVMENWRDRHPLCTDHSGRSDQGLSSSPKNCYG